MAFGSSTFSDFGGAVSDLFASSAHRSKAQGDLIEAKNYDLASDLANQNEKYTEASTAIKQSQLDRQIYQTIGGQQADCRWRWLCCVRLRARQAGPLNAVWQNCHSCH